MKTLVVGGTIGLNSKASTIISQLGTLLPGAVCNGGRAEDLSAYLEQVMAYDLILWWPNIENEVPKNYPIKTPGSVLICSKVLRENRDLGAAVARIFRMNANAVVAIDTTQKPFHFHLIDALGNTWIKTCQIEELVVAIHRFYQWTKDSLRVKTENIEIDKTLKNPDLGHFCRLVHEVADQVEHERGGRFFGNCSTRCAKMFPSWREEDADLIWVSARNIPKSRMSVNDFVPVRLIGSKVFYQGLHKPSIDTPVQAHLYQHYPHINYFIHGHAYLQSADFKVQTTTHYYPCGDLREVTAIIALVPTEICFFAINLKNHGFLIGSQDLTTLERFIKKLHFSYRNLGEEYV